MHAHAVRDIGVVFFDREVVGLPAFDDLRFKRKPAEILINQLLGLFVEMRRLSGVDDPLTRHLLERAIGQNDLAFAAARFEHFADFFEAAVRLEVAVAGGDRRAIGELDPLGGYIREEM